MIVNLFAGPGGWCQGLRATGYAGPTVGFDNSPDACATAVAAGHHRELADLTAFGPEAFAERFGPTDGVIASPVCKSWAVANVKRAGLDDARGRLIEIPLRWVRVLRPRWTAWEITPLALTVFELHAARLRGLGYSVWTGKVRAERFGVPSTRTRAVLIGRLDETVAEPAPTVDRPVSMAEALGWGGAEFVSNYGTNGDPKRRGRRGMHLPAFAVTGKACRNVWEWPDGRRRNLTPAEAGVLQGFPVDYPWRGGSISVQQQIGDAVPPLMAAAILAPLLADTKEAAA